MKDFFFQFEVYHEIMGVRYVEANNVIAVNNVITANLLHYRS